LTEIPERLMLLCNRTPRYFLVTYIQMVPLNYPRDKFRTQLYQNKDRLYLLCPEWSPSLPEG
jgi:hypothetical protein